MKTTAIFFLFMAHSTYSATSKAKPEALPVQYAVNMQDGGLILKEQRGGAPVKGWEWVYRSRSLHKGYFGQGWCSEIEMELRFESKGELRLWTCHRARPLTFKLSATSDAYVNTEDPDDFIKIRLGHYSRFKNNKRIARFNRQGQPLELLIHKIMWEIHYDKRQLPISMSHPGGAPLGFRWHPVLSLVTALQLNAQSRIDFRYEGFNLDQIITHSEGSIQTHEYNYDDLDNLVLWKGFHSTLRFDYHKNKDQIRRIQSRCDEKYEFTIESSKKRIGLLRVICPDGKNMTTHFEFNYDSSSARLPAQVHVKKVDESLKVAQRRSL